MVTIGSNNLFIIDNGATYPMSKIFDFFELNHINFIHFKKTDISLNCRTVHFYTNSELLDKLKDNLFRLELIAIDCVYDFKNILLDIRDITDIPVILISDKTPSDVSVFDNVYQMYKEEDTYTGMNVREYMEKLDSIYRVRDVINNESQTIESLRLEATRDYKLNKILK